MRETMQTMMEGTIRKSDTRPRRIANNTIQYEAPDGTRVVRLHRTDIIKFLPSGEVELNSGGWHTHTTRERLNSLSGIRVTPDRGVWYANDVPFFDGIRFKDGVAVNATDAETELASRRKLAKKINNFVRRIDRLSELPQPNPGDCWYCLMFDREKDNCRNGERAPHNADHLLAHLDEGYLPGALIRNALTWAGFRDPAQKADTVKRALRRYLRHRVGLG